MITYLLRFIWALIFQIIWNLFTICCCLYLLLFDLKSLKEQIKYEWKDIIYHRDCDFTDWFTFSNEGEWKSIFHWAFKIQKNKL